ncbi:DUF3060 domain-containing protein [Streptomyces sp. NPDC059894]|uniref:DUF3060 domain-containing protein n=1 Tax=unclassified Streptomyces TaxID=2593676 RepID=UPI0036648DCD
MAREEAGEPAPGTTNTFVGNAVHLVQARDIKGHIIFSGRTGSPWPVLGRLVASLVLSAGAGVCGWFALDRMTSYAPPPWTWVLAGAALVLLGGAGWGLALTTAGWRAYRSLGRAHRLAVACELLAEATRATWDREEKVRRLYDPKPLPVRWRTATSLHDHWPTIRDVEEDEPLPLNGRFDDILDVFERIDSRRLVVLGGPGSGKSVLATRFVLRHLQHRRDHHPAGPVAVLLPLSSWDPRDTFEAWAAHRIALDHPRLAHAGGSAESTAAELLHEGRLLPVLDGLDELPAAARPQVIEALNRMRGRETGRVVLTSRRAEYAAAVGEVGALQAAAVIELVPLAPDDLRRFLPLTGRTGARDTDGSKWQPVLDALPDDPDGTDDPDDPDEPDGTDDPDTPDGTDAPDTPDGTDGPDTPDTPDGTDGPDHPENHHAPDGHDDPRVPRAPDGHHGPRVPAAPGGPVAAASPDPDAEHGAMLRRALSTPLMTALARTAYSDTTASPAELLRRDRFRRQEDVEDHLLDQFVTAVYRPVPDAHGVLDDRWSADTARVWLGALARRLQRLGMREITWWRLGPGVPEACRLALECLALALPLAVTAWLVLGGPRQPQPPSPPAVLAVQAAACVIALLTRPPPGVDAGVAPRRLAVRGRIRAFAGQAALATPVVLAVGLPLRIPTVLLAALPVLFATRAFVDHAVDISRAAGPWQLLRADRTAVAVLGPVYALRGEGVSALRSWLLAGAALGPLLVTAAWHRTGGRDAVDARTWTLAAVAALVSLALLGAACSAWWGFTSTRVALALSGRLPWALGSFLEDAHRRGVLRQAGGVHAFRHARLQDRLAGGPAPAPTPAQSRRLPLPPPVVNLAALPVALVVLLALSLTPGVPGPYAASDVTCPALALPPGYSLTRSERADAETYDCAWSGETDPASAPPRDAGSPFVPPLPDTGYVGTYGLYLRISVLEPVYSLGAVDVAAVYYDRVRATFGTREPVSGLGSEAAITPAGNPVRLAVRVDNVVIVTVVSDTRTGCSRTSDGTALSRTAEALRDLGLSDDHPRLGEPVPAPCGGPRETEKHPTPPPSPSPSPTPTPTPTEEETPLPTELTIDTDGVHRSHVCHGGRVELHADDAKLTLTGTCGEVDVQGEGNGVYVERTDGLSIGGNLNSVYCRNPAKDVYRFPVFLDRQAVHTVIGCDP